MSDLLPFIIAGLVSGGVYGLAGLGLVLTYKTSGVFNFAHGALATVAAYAFYELYVVHGVSWPLSAVIVVVVVGPVMGLLLEYLARAIQGVSLALQVAATVGLLLFLEAGASLIYSTSETRIVPVFLSSGQLTIDSTPVQWSDIITFLIALVATVALTAFFRLSRKGAEMRAVVDSPQVLALYGVSPLVSRRWAWILGTVLTSASGVLFAPVLPLDPVQLTLLVVAAFGAAAIGAFTNLPLTFAGGLIIGVFGSLSQKWFTTGLLAGLPPSLPFVVLFVVLLVFPKRYLITRGVRSVGARSSWTAPARLQLGAGAVLVGLLACVPAVVGVHLTAWTTALATGIVFLSLSLLVRTSGQVSLCHVSFTAIGAAAFSHLAAGHHVPWLAALLLSGLIAVPIGAVLAVPAIRLTGLYLALATFGFGILLQGMFYSQKYMFGASGLGLPEPRPGWGWIDLHSDRGFYYLVLVFLVLSAVAVIALNRSRLGRLIRGLAESPVALETSGANVRITRVLVFCISAFLAAVGGALAGVAQSTVVGDSFQPLTSLLYFVLIIVIVGAEPWNALLAAAAVILVPSYLSGPHVPTWLQLIFGALAVVVAVLPAGAREVPLAVRTGLDRVFGRTAAKARVSNSATPSAVATPVRPGRLEVRNVQVRFGGVVAVDGLTLTAETGRVTGLIGPNGAGKTTTFNVCSGLLAPSAGAVAVDGHDVTRRGPAARARLGLGRTFQKMELFESLTVSQNVALGVEAGLAGADPLRHIASGPASAAAIRRATSDALELCGLSDLAERQVSALSTGHLRLVELARCLAGGHRILLLDEPSSGLDAAETIRFGQILKDVVEARGVGILLVEHDMSLVLDLCDHIYVLDFGKPIFAGTPTDIRSSAIVRAAYLGDADLEVPEPGSVSVVGT